MSKRYDNEGYFEGKRDAKRMNKIEKDIEKLFRLLQREKSASSTQVTVSNPAPVPITLSSITDLASIAGVALSMGGTTLNVVVSDIDHDDTGNIDAADIKHLTAAQLGALHAEFTSADAVDAVEGVANAPIATGDSVIFTDLTDGVLKQDLVSDLLALSASGIENVVEDTTPQLGGDLDLNSKGITEELTCGVETGLVPGDLCYMGPDGYMHKADANQESSCDTLLAISLDTLADTVVGTFLLFGRYTTSGLSPSAEVFVSTTAGAWTHTRPSVYPDIVRHVGTALSATVLYFNPSHTYVEIKA